MATVLLVDDDAGVRQFVAACLAGVGFQVLCASDAQQALEKAGAYEHEIQLLLSDIEMSPGMSGLELSRRLHAQRPETRVLLMSGSGYQTQAGNEGWEFIDKPFAPQLLQHKIRSLLG